MTLKGLDSRYKQLLANQKKNGNQRSDEFDQMMRDKGTLIDKKNDLEKKLKQFSLIVSYYSLKLFMSVYLNSMNFP